MKFYQNSWFLNFQDVLQYFVNVYFSFFLLVKVSSSLSKHNLHMKLSSPCTILVNASSLKLASFSLGCYIFLIVFRKCHQNFSSPADYDECRDFNYHCPHDSHCINKEGSYTCKCNKGFRLDANKNCEGWFNSR